MSAGQGLALGPVTIERQFHCRRGLGEKILTSAVCGTLAVFAAVIAWTGYEVTAIERQLGIHDLPTATVIRWILVAVNLGIAACFGWWAVISKNLKHRIVITSTSVIIPKSAFSQEEVAVEYGDIIALKLWRVVGHRYLRICHKKGGFTIDDKALPSKSDFDEIGNILRQRIPPA